jgi:sugar phosphate permease
MQMKGLANLSGWRWIFIIEGIITCLLALLGFWLLVDFPDSMRGSWSFLDARERRWVVDRVNRDRGDAIVPPFNLKQFLSGGLDWKIWAYGLLFCFTTTIAYALAYFLPIILVQNMGFDVGAAQCLVAPPYAFAAIVTYAIGWAGDRFHVRGPLIIINMLLCVIGLPIVGFHSSAAVRYFAIFFVTAGANSNVPAVMSWQANNIRGQWKRAFCSAILVGFGGVGGIAGSLVFRDMDAPGYRPGLYACLAAALLNILLSLVLMADIWRNNKAADRSGKILEAVSLTPQHPTLRVARPCFQAWRQKLTEYRMPARTTTSSGTLTSVVI